MPCCEYQGPGWRNLPDCAGCAQQARHHRAMHPHNCPRNAPIYSWSVFPSSDPFDPFHPLDRYTQGETTMPATPAHVSPTAQTIEGPKTFYQAAIASLLYPQPRIIQARYADGTLAPDSMEIDSVDTEARTVTGWWLCHQHGGGQRLCAVTYGERVFGSAYNWYVIDPIQPDLEPEWLENVTLARAVESAGVGGEVMWNSGNRTRYAVVVADGGTHALVDPDTNQAISLGGFDQGQHWNVTAKGDGSRVRVGANTPVTSDDSAEAPDSERYSLFVAVALAGGVGGVVTAAADSNGLRILACDSEETGSLRWTADTNDGDSGAAEVSYNDFTYTLWRVVRQAPETTPQSPATERPAPVLPRTAAEAERMRALIAGQQAIFAPGLHLEGSLFDALDTLALYLPGGEAERKGVELALGAVLCASYEEIVCPTLGWTPRPQHSVYANRIERFTQAMDTHEVEAAQQGLTVADTLTSWAERYERGGVVNQALVDHIEAHLEGHKVDAANALLEELGMNGVEAEAEREYEVEVELSQTRMEYLTQTVTVTVTAESEEEARRMVEHREVDPWDADNGDWDYQDSDVSDSSERVIGVCEA